MLFTAHKFGIHILADFELEIDFVHIIGLRRGIRKKQAKHYFSLNYI